MTPETARLVQDSFAQVEPIAETAAALFYGRLFELDPSLRALFHGDMNEQGRKLMTTLKVVVASVNRLDAIVPAVQHLGRRHAGYQVEARHYDTVGEALLWTLEKGLGPSFTPQTRQAWAEVYVILANVMKQAAEEQEREAVPV